MRDTVAKRHDILKPEKYLKCLVVTCTDHSQRICMRNLKYDVPISQTFFFLKKKRPLVRASSINSVLQFLNLSQPPPTNISSLPSSRPILSNNPPPLPKTQKTKKPNPTPSPTSHQKHSMDLSAAQADISKMSESDKRDLTQIVNAEMQKAKIEECPSFLSPLPHLPPLPHPPSCPHKPSLTPQHSNPQPDRHMFFEMRDGEDCERAAGARGGVVRAELRGALPGRE